MLNTIKDLLGIKRKAKSRLRRTAHRDYLGRFTKEKQVECIRYVKFTYLGQEQTPIIMKHYV